MKTKKKIFIALAVVVLSVTAVQQTMAGWVFDGKVGASCYDNMDCVPGLYCNYVFVGRWEPGICVPYGM